MRRAGLPSAFILERLSGLWVSDGSVLRAHQIQGALAKDHETQAFIDLSPADGVVLNSGLGRYSVVIGQENGRCGLVVIGSESQ